MPAERNRECRLDKAEFPYQMKGTPVMSNKNNKARNMQSWRPMATAPHTAEWVQVKMKNGKVFEAHWASNLSGEDQPPFQGWFAYGGKHWYREIVEPIAWKPKDSHKT